MVLLSSHSCNFVVVNCRNWAVVAEVYFCVFDFVDLPLMVHVLTSCHFWYDLKTVIQAWIFGAKCIFFHVVAGIVHTYALRQLLHGKKWNFAIVCKSKARIIRDLSNLYKIGVWHLTKNCDFFLLFESHKDTWRKGPCWHQDLPFQDYP